MESGVYESGNEQKTIVQKRGKTGCHRKKLCWCGDVGFEFGGIFNMMSTIREKSFAILI